MLLVADLPRSCPRQVAGPGCRASSHICTPAVKDTAESNQLPWRCLVAVAAGGGGGVGGHVGTGSKGHILVSDYQAPGRMPVSFSVGRYEKLSMQEREATTQRAPARCKDQELKAICAVRRDRNRRLGTVTRRIRSYPVSTVQGKTADLNK